jgi:cellulose synthase/poly-beta-1,6-N-acetylglucosamine synthase-like glycosyltransferase
VASGDDDLFINKAANKENTQIEIHPDSFTLSEAKKTFKEWWKQKRRHLSVSRYYKFKHKFLLGSYSFSLILTLLLLVILLSFQQYIIVVLILFGVRLLSKMVVFKKSADKLNEKKLLLISPLIEVFLLLVFPIMTLMNLVFKQNKWK